jgi:hypothetical protein
MITKEIVKNKIDNLPEYLLKNLYTYIDSITIDIKKKKTLHTYKLNGKFDNINIRSKAYE